MGGRHSTLRADQPRPPRQFGRDEDVYAVRWDHQPGHPRFLHCKRGDLVKPMLFHPTVYLNNERTARFMENVVTAQSESGQVGLISILYLQYAGPSGMPNSQLGILIEKKSFDRDITEGRWFAGALSFLEAQTFLLEDAGAEDGQYVVFQPPELQPHPPSRWPDYWLAVKCVSGDYAQFCREFEHGLAFNLDRGRVQAAVPSAAKLGNTAAESHMMDITQGTEEEVDDDPGLEHTQPSKHSHRKAAAGGPSEEPSHNEPDPTQMVHLQTEVAHETDEKQETDVKKGKAEDGSEVRKGESMKGLKKVDSLNGIKKTESLKVVKKAESLKVVKQMDSSKVTNKVESLRAVKKAESLKVVKQMDSSKVTNKVESLKAVKKAESLKVVKKAESLKVVKKAESLKAVKKGEVNKEEKDNVKKESEKVVKKMESEKCVKKAERNEEKESKKKSEKKSEKTLKRAESLKVGGKAAEKRRDAEEEEARLAEPVRLSLSELSGQQDAHATAAYARDNPSASEAHAPSSSDRARTRPQTDAVLAQLAAALQPRAAGAPSPRLVGPTVVPPDSLVDDVQLPAVFAASRLRQLRPLRTAPFPGVLEPAHGVVFVRVCRNSEGGFYVLHECNGLFQSLQQLLQCYTYRPLPLANAHACPTLGDPAEFPADGAPRGGPAPPPFPAARPPPPRAHDCLGLVGRRAPPWTHGRPEGALLQVPSAQERPHFYDLDYRVACGPACANDSPLGPCHQGQVILGQRFTTSAIKLLRASDVKPRRFMRDALKLYAGTRKILETETDPKFSYNPQGLQFLARLTGFDIRSESKWVGYEFVGAASVRDVFDNEPADRRLYLRGRLEVAYQVSSAMSHLESNGLCHRALKCSNFIITHRSQFSWRIRVTDYMLPYSFLADAADNMNNNTKPNNNNNNNNSLRALHWRWMAPESLSGRQFDIAADVWSFGCALFELLTWGLEPWRADDTVRGLEDLQRHVSAQNWISFPTAERLPGFLKILCWVCMSVQVADRPTFNKLHQFFLDLLFDSSQSIEHILHKYGLYTGGNTKKMGRVPN